MSKKKNHRKRMKEYETKHKRDMKVGGAEVVERGHNTIGNLDWSINYLNKQTKQPAKKVATDIIKEAIKEANRPKNKRRKWQQR